MKKRDEIKSEYKWDLSHIYNNYGEWEKDFENIKEKLDELVKYKNSLGEEEKFLEFLKKDEEINKMSYKLYRYPQLARDLNAKDEVAVKYLQGIESLFAEMGTKLAWVEAEILENKGNIEKWLEKEEFSEYKFNLKNLFRLQEHILDEEKSRLLSYYSNFNSAPRSIYFELTTSDVISPEVELEDGRKILVTAGNYSSEISTNRNQRDRKKLFEAYYGLYKNKENTIGAIYASILQKNIASTKAYNYKNFLARALEHNNIPEEVYINLINSAKNNTKALQKYIKLRKKMLKLEKYYVYDNAISLIDYDEKYDYELAKNLVLESVKPMGEKYVEKMREALANGWIDVYETENKRIGAYSAGVYGVHPYMLMNYNGTLDSVFTLAHELGHTLHTLYSHQEQPFSTSEYTIFVAEVASTFNERLLLDYMIENSKNPMERIKLLEEEIGNIVGTFYTQVMFADFEYRAHKLEEEGKPVTAGVLSGIVKDLYKEYYGESMDEDELMNILWSRIPHFYNSSFYVYQYATSFVASMKLYEEAIRKNNKESLEKYLELLSSGGNDFPVEQLKKAGIDLTKGDLGEIVSQKLESLIEKLEKEME